MSKFFGICIMFVITGLIGIIPTGTEAQQVIAQDASPATLSVPEPKIEPKIQVPPLVGGWSGTLGGKKRPINLTVDPDNGGKVRVTNPTYTRNTEFADRDLRARVEIVDGIIHISAPPLQIELTPRADGTLAGSYVSDGGERGRISGMRRN